MRAPSGGAELPKNPLEIIRREVRTEDAEHLIRITRAPCKSSAKVVAQALVVLKQHFCLRLAAENEPTGKQAERYFLKLDATLRKLMPLLGTLECNSYFLELLAFAADQEFQPQRDQMATWRGLRNALASVRSLHDWTKQVNYHLPTGRSTVPSPITWLLGAGIPAFFEHHFDDPYGLAADKTGNPNSPGARFACGVLKIFDLSPYTVRHLQNARKEIREHWGLKGEIEA
jgi:hypothetical protein